jgi:hypothetical protein
MSDDLKTCPFCGGDKNIVCTTDYDGRDAYAVSCRYHKCHGSIFTLGYGYFADRAEAIAAWNTRTPDTSIEALTEQLEAARTDAKEAEAYAEELEKERDRWREIANNEAVEGEANRNAGLALETKLAKAVKALLLARVHVANNEQGWSVGRASARSDLKIINATLAEIEGSNAP